MRIFTLITLLALIFVPAVLGEVRIAQSDVMKSAVTHPQPEYSYMARQMKITGRIEIEAVITSDGSVETAKAISGNPLLTGPAVNAVKKWKFNPIVMEGQPVKAVTTLTFEFK